MELALANESFFKRKLVETLVRRRGVKRKMAKLFVNRLARAIESGERVVPQFYEGTVVIPFKNMEPCDELPQDMLQISLKAKELEELFMRVAD